MSIPRSLREMHPYKLVLLAALVGVVLLQIGAMVWVTQTQVVKAKTYYATVEAAPAADTDRPHRQPRNDVMQVGYAGAQ